MNTILRFVIVFLAVAPCGYCVGLCLNLDDLLQADLIARVTIVSLIDTNSDRGYGRVAHATVTDAAKGAKVGEALDLLCSPYPIIGCGPIHYKVGDDCIVVARRRPTGRYETMNSSAGKFEIREGEYINPYFDRSKEDTKREIPRPDFENQSPEGILDGLRRLLPQIKRQLQVQSTKRWWQFWR